MDVIPGATRTTAQNQLPSDSRFDNLVPRAFPLKVGKSPGNEVVVLRDRKKVQIMIVGEISQNLTVI